MIAPGGISIVGCILAGGLSTRMQGPEKTLMRLGGRPMIELVYERLAAQVNTVIINANGDAERFAFTDLPVQPDIIKGFAGPLAGVHAGMSWAVQHAPTATHLLTVAGDTPFFPDDLASRLADAVAAKTSAQNETIALAYSDGNRHPTFGLWPISLKNDLQCFLDAGDRKVMLFAQRFQLQKVDFPLMDERRNRFDPFFNVNTPDDFAQAERLLDEPA